MAHDSNILFFLRLKNPECTRIALVANSDAGYKPEERGASLARMLFEHLDSTTWRFLVTTVNELMQAQKPSTPPDERPSGRSRF